MNKLKRRRLKNVIEKNKTVILISVALCIILFLACGYAILNVILDFKGTTTIKNKEPICENLDVEFTWGDSWVQGGLAYYQANLAITNIGDENIVNWVMKIKGPSDLTAIAQADIGDNVGGVLTIKAATDSEQYSWAATIRPSETLRQSIQFITIERRFNPEYIKFNDCEIYHGENVEPDIPIDPDAVLESLEIYPSQNSMEIGEAICLGVIKIPENAPTEYVWISSDPSVATVSQDGIVTGISEGTAIITVSSGEIFATSNVTVVTPNPDTPPENPHSLKLDFIKENTWGNTYQFTINILNNTPITITHYEFEFALPEGTEYNIFYAPGLTITGNKFVFDLDNALETGGTSSFSGQITVPNGYDISDYINETLDPVLMNIIFN